MIISIIDNRTLYMWFVLSGYLVFSNIELCVILFKRHIVDNADYLIKNYCRAFTIRTEKDSI